MPNLAKPGTLLHLVINEVEVAKAKGMTPKYLVLHPDTVQRHGEPHVQDVATAVECALVQSPFVPPGAALLMADDELEFVNPPNPFDTGRLYQ